MPPVLGRRIGRCDGDFTTDSRQTAHGNNCPGPPELSLGGNKHGREVVFGEHRVELRILPRAVQGGAQHARL